MSGEKENKPIAKVSNFGWHVKEIVNEHISTNLPTEVQFFLLKGMSLYQRYDEPTYDQWKREYRDIVEPLISFPDKQRGAFEKVSWFIARCREEQGLDERKKIFRELVNFFETIPYHLPLTQDDKNKSNIFKKEVDSWVIIFEGERVMPKDCKGLHYIHHLIRNQGKVVSASDLRSIVNKAMTVNPANETLLKGEQLLAVSNMASTEKISDLKAIQDYQRRRKELKCEIAEYEEINSSVPEKCRAELEAIEDELGRCLAKNGTLRTIGSKIETDRKAVSYCIKEALKKIRKVDKSLTYNHLQRSINLGSEFSYLPEKQIDWQF